MHTDSNHLLDHKTCYDPRNELHLLNPQLQELFGVHQPLKGCKQNHILNEKISTFRRSY